MTTISPLNNLFTATATPEKKPIVSRLLNKIKYIIYTLFYWMSCCTRDLRKSKVTTTPPPVFYAIPKTDLKNIWSGLKASHQDVDKMLTFESNGTKYVTWYSIRFKAIVIQDVDSNTTGKDTGKISLSVNTDESSAKEIRVNNIKTSGIPNKFSTLFKDLAKEFPGTTAPATPSPNPSPPPLDNPPLVGTPPAFPVGTPPAFPVGTPPPPPSLMIPDAIGVHVPDDAPIIGVAPPLVVPIAADLPPADLSPLDIPVDEFKGMITAMSQRNIRQTSPLWIDLGDGTKLAAWKHYSQPIINIQLKQAGDSQILAFDTKDKTGILILPDQTYSYMSEGEAKDGLLAKHKDWFLKLDAKLKEPIILDDVHTHDNYNKTIEYMLLSHKNLSRRLAFTHNGETFFAWSRANNRVLNIQRKTEYDLGEQTQKLGISFTAGNITTVFGNNTMKETPTLNTIELEVLASLIKACDDEIAANAPLPDLFEPQDMILLYHHLKKNCFGWGQRLDFESDGVKYCAWHSKRADCDDVFLIQGKHLCDAGFQDDKIGIKVRPHTGEIVSITVDNKAETSLSDELLPRVRDAFVVAADANTTYTQNHWGGNLVKYPKNALTHNIATHLAQYAKFVKDELVNGKNDPKFNITFLNNDLSNAPGDDAGGLLRTYFSEMPEAVMDGHHKGIKFIQKQGFKVPTAIEEPDLANFTLPNLKDEEKEAYEALGVMIIHNYRSKNTNGAIWNNAHSMGVHFSEDLFTAIMSLENDEIDGAITPDKFIALVDVLTKKDPTAKSYQNMVKWLAPGLDPNSLSDDDFQNIYYSLTAPEDIDALVLVDDEPNVAKMKQHWKKVQDGLHKSLLELLGGEIPPLVAIARGMRSIMHTADITDHAANRDHWNGYKTNPNIGKIICEGAQGRVDPATIAASVESNILHTPIDEKAIIEQKIVWLKEWIVDPATDAKEVKIFLKGVTGAKSIGKAEKIKIDRQVAVSPLPEFHTCSNTMEICGKWNTLGANKDNTKEAFIASMLFAIKASPGFLADDHG